MVARWVFSSARFDEAFNEIHQKPFRSASPVFLALSRTLPILKDCANYVEKFLQTRKVLSDLISMRHEPEHLKYTLLALHRIYRTQPSRFYRYIDPEQLYRILACDDNYAVCKYLAIQILCRYLNASEASRTNMVTTHLTPLPSNLLESLYDCGYQVDYRFIDLIDAKLFSDLSRMPENASSVDQQKVTITSSALDPSVVCVSGILISRPTISSREPVEDSVVATVTSRHVLKSLAQLYQTRQAVLLHGKAGSGKTFFISAFAKYLGCENDIVNIHLGEQTDAKLLTGAYTSGKKPGSFEWHSGVLATAARDGKWVLVEDIDKAPTDVLSILLTLLEKRELNIPSRGQVIKASSNFQLFATIRSMDDTHNLPDIIGLRLWHCITVETPSEIETRAILCAKFPVLQKLVTKFISVYDAVVKIYSSSSFMSLNRGLHPRVISIRDLIKFCARCDAILCEEGITSPNDLIASSLYEFIFYEAVDCFGGALTEHGALICLVTAIGEILEVAPSRVNFFLTKYVPAVNVEDEKIKIGRAVLQKSVLDKALYVKKKPGNNTSFVRTKHSARLLEQVGVAVQMCEPVLLVGETGTGKTTIVQEIAKMMNKKLTVINVSQQTESGDLLGGYKPVNTKSVAVPLQERFEQLFLVTFSQRKNAKFSDLLTKCFNRGQWKNVVKLWKEAVKMARGNLCKEGSDEETDGGPKKKRKVRTSEKAVLLQEWDKFLANVGHFEAQASNLANSFVFNFVEGPLVRAIRNGEWLLLDEINLASPDTLESIADLLSKDSTQRSILLSERGDIEATVANPDFRIFGCMNPSTDVGKRDLPASIRSRFSEIYVRSPDKDREDLAMIVDRYVNRYAIGDEWVVEDVVELYLAAKGFADANKIVDGAGQKPHFSIRTLTRTLIYVCDIVDVYGLRRALYEGFCMTFLTPLSKESENFLKPLIEQYTISKLKNAKQVLSRCPLPPDDGHEYVQFKHYWIRRGPGEVSQSEYIVTPFVERNLLNLVRATTTRRFPVLVQGPTSAGKTSMIKYLANLTGHEFVRINNHEHTDLQEYLGTYVSDSSGKLVFREGVMVEALRKGHWIVLDELNLAPTDVLEALNRLLDDNRELFIPETQEVFHPHPNFMIFATQNPPGLYGGRKVLSRAFRNRFLDLHFDDIPQDELEIILRERCKIAPSYAQKIVEVYRQLSVRRQSTRLFEQKDSFATLRDLFRWALRDAVGYEELAANGYMLLAERVRSAEEKHVVKEALEKVMRVKLDMDAYYEQLENKALMNTCTSIVWTKAIRRLFVLVETSIKYKEPLLLVGETGCGKTTICQLLAQLLGRQIITLNAHQNTETGDILGAQRPVRNRFEMRSLLMKDVLTLLSNHKIDVASSITYDELVKLFHSVKRTLPENEVTPIDEKVRETSILFEWNDGPLTQAMRQGDFFLLDEISLADDSVLERLNSVLEPERTLLLAEKGTDDSFVVARDTFQFLATMNPGGDYGKKELSPALRNRFTEIWVPSMEDPADVKQIVSSILISKRSSLGDVLVDYSYWFADMLSNGNTTSGVISLRDILAWVEFINSCDPSLEQEIVLLNGALMVFIDALGTNSTAYLASNEKTLKEHKLMCVRNLAEISGFHLVPLFESPRCKVEVTSSVVKAGDFEIARKTRINNNSWFNLDAPTTAANAMCCIRAMQSRKPILLEGSPGVGKTSLVTALAKAVGSPLVRINLSEQTDLIDLFGSEAPVEGGKTGEFVWQDAPFLRAMKNGEWVLLDEMNLASQSILEGLNACLDHRGETYIPELDRTFPCHPGFRVFAAQNPLYQGGGRKGLPKSFVNRFSVVFMDMLKTEDLRIISAQLFPSIPSSDCYKMITFISQLEEEVVVKKKWGQAGGPWEFNLRDTLRWMSLLNREDADVISAGLKLEDFLDMVVCQRFRTLEDRNHAESIFVSVFGEKSQKDLFWDLAPGYLQACGSIIARTKILSYTNTYGDVPLLALQSNVRIIESTIRSVNECIPIILTGPTNSGKTSLIRFLASAVGVQLLEFSMNSDVDSMDILGGYEQVDLSRDMNLVVQDCFSVLNELAVINAQSGATDSTIVSQCLSLLGFLKNIEVDQSNFTVFVLRLTAFVGLFSNKTLSALLERTQEIKKKMEEAEEIRFNWFDGMLVRAVTHGGWLVLDNANLCHPSVLDRLNSLLEPKGSLVISNCSQNDGSARVLTPHPNFRLFLTADPRYGEFSRAMRNRCIEIFLEDLPSRSTNFDKICLGYSEDGFIPISSFISSTDSTLRTFASLQECVSINSETLASSVVGTLSISSLALVPAWSRSMAPFSDSAWVEKVQEVKDLLETTGYVSRMGQIYGGLDSSLVVNQKLHFRVNEYLNDVMLIKAQEYPTSEITILFQVAANILQSQVIMDRIELKALHAKVDELSFLEMSAAVALDRYIRKPPRVQVYAYVKAVAQLLADLFRKATDIFSPELIHLALLKLQCIWSCLVKSSANQNLSQLRVYLQIIADWILSNESIPLINEYADKISSLEVGLELTSGFSMVKIWQKFRQSYPRSEQAWEFYRRLCALTFNFDTIVQKLYSDTHQGASSLRTLLMALYGDVVAETVISCELELILLTVENSILRLADICDSFVIERMNRFIDEFTELHNVLEASSYFQKEDIDKLIILSNYTRKSTISLVNCKGDMFLPYPRIFDGLWSSSGDSVKPLFTNELLLTTLVKTIDISKCPGKYLVQGLGDLGALRDQLASNSAPLLNPPIERFASVLSRWTVQILELHDLENVSFASVKELESLMNQSEDQASAQILKSYFLPLWYILSRNPTIGQLGKAWVLFATGCIQLFVPSSPLDPAIEEHVKWEVHSSFSETIEKIIDSWKSIRTVISGDELMNLEKVGPVAPEEKTAKCEVFRSATSVDELFDEWNSFMETDIAPEPMARILDAAENLQATLNEQIVGVFEKNSSSLLARLKNKYFFYADLNEIFAGFVYSAKLGVSLMRIQHDNDSAKISVPYSWGLELVNVLNDACIRKTFDGIKSIAKSLGSSSVLSEKLMHYFLNVCFFNNSMDITTEVFEAIYYKWYYRKLKTEEKDAKESSFYRYKGADDGDDDFKEMFPDFDEVLTLDSETQKSNDSFEDIYHSIAQSYVLFYLSKNSILLSSLVEQGAELCRELQTQQLDLMSDQSNSSQLASLLHVMNNYELVFSTAADREVSFYHEPNPYQFARAMKEVLVMYETVLGLLKQWPEHATLQNISRLADEFLDYPSSFPLNKLLHKVEIIYNLISDWEKFSLSQVSLRAHLDALARLIVSWRRLELLSWKSLFKQEELAFQKNIGKWWCYLFEVIIVPLFGDGVLENFPSLLLAGLNVFMGEAMLGEYRSRLDLLKAFRNHVKEITPDEKGVVNGLSNLLAFYDLFVPQIDDHINQTKKALEKDVSEVILLASWKDVNVDALKQSSRKSHNNLYKLVRKYRALLSTSVASTIETGFTGDKLPLKTLTVAPATYLMRSKDEKLRILSLCLRVFSWSKRPAHLTKLDTLENNMRVYTDRIVDHKYPDLFEYAQSVVGEMERLRKETPSVMNDDTKKTVAALKNQKHKLLSDTLKELRRIGVNTSSKQDVKTALTTVNSILVNSASFEGTCLENTDLYYFRILELLPRLRSAVLSGNEEVPQADLERGMAATENLVISLKTTRKPLLDLARAVEAISAVRADFELLGDTQGIFLKASLICSYESNCAQIHTYCGNLVKILEYAATLADTLKYAQGSMIQSILSSAQSHFLSFLRSLPSLKSRSYTDHSLSIVHQFKEDLEKLKKDLTNCAQERSSNSFLALLILDWMLASQYTPFVSSCMTLQSLQCVDDFEAVLRKLTNSGLLAVQKIIELQKKEISADDDKWFSSAQSQLVAMLKLLRHSTFIHLLNKCQEAIHQIEHNSESSQLCQSLLVFTMPVVVYYGKLCSSLLGKASADYALVAKSTYILAKSLYTLASDGFCSPESPNEQKIDNNLHDGTGLGDGEGVESNSKDAEEDEDLTEQAQQPNEENNNADDVSENDDAVEISGDMVGNLENMSAQDSDEEDQRDKEEEEELDEEIDDLDDVDPNAIDEKMWDEEAKEKDKEKHLEKVPEDSVQDDQDIKANEDNEENSKEESKDQDGDNNDDINNDNDDSDDGEEEDIGEQEDEVRNDNGEDLDDHVPETDALELPDDLNLDDDQDSDDDQEVDIDYPMDVDEEFKNEEKDNEKIDESEEVGQDESEDEEVANIDEEQFDTSADDETQQTEESQEKNPDQDNQGEESQGDQSDEDAGNRLQEEKQKEDKDESAQQDADEAAIGDVGIEDQNEDIDEDAAAQTKVGMQGHGADERVAEEKNDIGASGEILAETKQADQEGVSEDSARDHMKESMKQLGDSLKEFHRRRNEIKEASDVKQEEQQLANTKPDEFQHVEGENSKHDTQALSAADSKDQVQSIDEELAINEEETEQSEPVKTEDDMEVDTAPANENANAEPETDAEDFGAKFRGGLVDKRKEIEPEDSAAVHADFEAEKPEIFEEEGLREDFLLSSEDRPCMDLETARALWKHSELATQELASGLCEQLRLILEPTLATKLRGDYKTGKRLNMKRIISYIASDFRKDKIWLRRTKPAKRQYQIMISVDDSKSMSESNSTELALHCIALVSKALTQLESGELSIVRFGEDVKLVHPFDKPFNQNVGAEVFRWFDFQQEKTDIKQLCSKSIKIFENARSVSNADLWQLQIIISDGVCEDHEIVRRLVRRAREEKVMLVFVVIDGISSKELILEMSQVSYVPDPVTGAMTLTVGNYLDTFPFELYVIVSNINELPEMLSSILRQYFSEVANI